MSGWVWFCIGVLVTPVGIGAYAVWTVIGARFRDWYTRPRGLTGKSLAFRRSLITALTLELLDATHVRAIRLPFNRIIVIRSNPAREYDFIGKEWVVIGDDYNNAREVIGRALDALGYEEDR